MPERPQTYGCWVYRPNSGGVVAVGHLDGLNLPDRLLLVLQPGQNGFEVGELPLEPFPLAGEDFVEVLDPVLELQGLLVQRAVFARDDARDGVDQAVDAGL